MSRFDTNLHAPDKARLDKDRASAIALAALVMLGGLLWFNRLNSMADIWMFVIILAVVVVFYFCLLLCRTVYFWMTRGGYDMAMWDKAHMHEAMKHKK